MESFDLANFLSQHRNPKDSRSVNIFTPFLSREELLSKNIVEIKKNEEVEFGYAFYNNNSDIIFCTLSDTHEAIMHMPDQYRQYLLTSEADKVPVRQKPDPFLKHNFFDAIVKDTAINGDYSVVDDSVNYLKKYQPNDYEKLKGQYFLHFANDKVSYLAMGRYVFEHFIDDLAMILPSDFIYRETFKKVSEHVIEENTEVCDFLNSTNLESPFDEVVIKHYLVEDDKAFEPDAEIYTHFKVVDREKNIVSAWRYAYSHRMNLWVMPAYGTYVMGRNAEDVKKAIKKSLKTTHIDDTVDMAKGAIFSDCLLPYDYASYIYAWYKCLRNREVEIREVTAKAKKEDATPKSKRVKREYVEGATKNERRVINLGSKLVVYTKDETAVKSIKKRSVTWHVDSFFRRGTECTYHRKDGKITKYSRKGSIVRPNKNKNTEKAKEGVTYIIK